MSAQGIFRIIVGSMLTLGLCSSAVAEVIACKDMSADECLHAAFRAKLADDQVSEVARKESCQLGSGLACAMLKHDAKSMQRICDKNSEDGFPCLVAATSSKFGDPASIQYYRLARARLDKSCSNKDGFSCLGAGTLSGFLAGNDLSIQKLSQDYFKKACELGESVGCLQEADIVQATTHDGLPLYQRACSMGLENACVRVGAVLSEQGKDSEARIVWASLCEKGNFKACGFAGLVSEKAKDKVTARKLYLKSCEGGIEASCIDLGNIELENGNTVRARELLQGSCERLEQRACVALGNLEKNLGNNQKAVGLFGKACSKQLADGCLNLAILEIQNRKPAGAMQHLKIARKIFGAECDRGNNEACSKLTQLSKLGVGN